MSYLIDTNVLLRWSQPESHYCAIALSAVNRLIDQGESLLIAPQNLIEFWNVATRPINANGLGLTPSEAETKVVKLEGVFDLAEETPEIHPAWRKIVVVHTVSGVQVHDARLVAIMQVHNISHLLTFDSDDFRRYAQIQVVNPTTIS